MTSSACSDPKHLLGQGVTFCVWYKQNLCRGRQEHVRSSPPSYHLPWESEAIENLGHSNDGCFVDSTLTAYKVALLWTILYTNRHDTLTKTLTQNSSIDSHLFRRVNCQECRPPSKTKDRTQGCLMESLVFRGPRCLVFGQLDPGHPGSPPFWNKVYAI